MRSTLYTVTPNPALDLSGEVEGLVPNEKNYVSRERRDPGGNGINSARVATRLGARVTALGWMGGPTGAEIEALLEREGVRCEFTPIAGQTRVNVTVSNLGTHQQTRLTFPGPRVTPKEKEALLRRVRSLRAPGIFVVGGSLPQGCAPDFHLTLAREAHARGLGVVLDVPSKFLKKAVGGRGFAPLLVKPNEVELAEWWGKPLRTERALLDAAHAMAEHAALVCVSLAERGAWLVTRGHAWRGAAVKVRARGTVGAGDSMVGAMCVRLLHHGLTECEDVARLLRRSPGTELPRELQDVLRWGLAAGAATAEVSGTALASAAAIRKLTRRA